MSKDLSISLLNALENEKLIDYESTHQLLTSSSPKLLARNGQAVLNLSINNIRKSFTGKSIIELVIHSAVKNNNGNPFTDFKTGDIVKLQEMNKSEKDNEKDKDKDKDNDIFNIDGVVSKSSNEKINIVISKDCDEIWSNNSKFWIVKISNESTYKRMESTLRKLNEFKPNSITDILTGEKKYIPKSKTSIDSWNNEFLNDSQKDAIEFAIGNEICIIHGPPGTGKTSTLIELILQLKNRINGRILITAASNIAADTILEKLSHYEKKSKRKRSSNELIRIGHPVRIMNHLRNYSLDYIINENKGKEFKDLENEIIKLEKEVRKPRISKEWSNRKSIWNEIKLLNKELKLRNSRIVNDTIKNAKIIISTLHGSGSWELVSNNYGNGIENFQNFIDVLIIDEVSQAMEPSCWIPIINHSPKKLIIAGDHKQLPPTLHMNENNKFFKILSMSLFDRLNKLYENNLPFKKFLNVQYRMCEKIMKFPSYKWYNNELIAHSSVANGKLIDLIQSPENFDDDLIEQIIWYDTQGMYDEIEDENGSKYNIGECYIIQKHIKKLIKLGISIDDIGVIAPYNAQVARLRELLWNGIIEEDGIIDEKFNVEISTVDGFQGREKEIILLSLVRTSNENFGNSEIGFVSDERRLNVSITRSKKQLFVVGDLNTFEKSGLNEWCDWIYENAEIRYDVE